MAEIVTLGTPITDVTLVGLVLDWPGEQITVILGTEGGGRINHELFGGEAVAFMRALNRADLSKKSLHRRVLEKLVAKGVLRGTVSGEPD
jgi:hypothetical protein